MGERTEHAPGTHSWVDLSTSDLEGAKSFYTELLGWDRIDDQPVPGQADRTYSTAYVGDRAAAALYVGEGEVPPHWNCYITVESADDTAEKARSIGAEVLMAAFDIGTAGRMAFLQDPTGGIFAVWEPRDSIGAERVNERGCLTWNDLNTGDPEAARSFYGELFGWGFEAVEGFPYWVIRNGDRMNGGIRGFTEHERGSGIPAHWLPYFAVDDAQAATGKVEELGGHVMIPPTQVPGGGVFAVVQDPQGAFFAVFAGEFED